MTDNNRPKVLFAHGHPPGGLNFVRTDLQILSSLFTVEELSLPVVTRGNSSFTTPAVWKAIARNDVVFGWFGPVCASLAMIARVIGKPSIIVAGGSEVVSVPEIGYGLISHNWVQRLHVLLGLRIATRVLLYSEASRRSLLQQRGMRESNLQTGYLCVDTAHFRPGARKLPQALTVGFLDNSNLRRKGLLSFAQASRIASDVEFRMGGKVVDESALSQICAAAGERFLHLGYLDDAALLREYQEARTYVQVSMHEGFGVALAEAMACECAPIVTRAGSLPEVVGATGVFVPANDPEALARAVRDVATSRSSAELGRRARERVQNLFSVERRRQLLGRVIEEVTERRKRGASV